MIYTLTVNPSIDYIVDVSNFNAGGLNRTTAEKINAGGKGINVSIVLNNLGIETCALGFVAGFTGAEIEEQLRQIHIKTDFIHIKEGFSRINVKLRSFCPNATNTTSTATNTPSAPSTAPAETEINGQGPQILPIYIEELLQKLQILQNGDTLVLAGSIPGTLPKTFYCQIMQSLQNKKINFVVDATKELLTRTLEYKPFLIKPNLQELAELFGISPGTLNSKSAVADYAKRLQQMGAQNVLVSLAGDGAVLVCKDGEVLQSAAPKCTLVNSVGAGDSMVAGFIAGFLQSQKYSHALKLAVCAGTASAASQNLADKAQIEKMFNSFN
ncbi:MAG: 1-phosphofructokinase [Treponemataceae bacterium]|nr:1-phosphofructokinase [Treponemataceae bacterium]